MKNRLKLIKESFKLKVEKLSERELSFLTGGGVSGAGSSGTGSGSTENSACCCDATGVHCCEPEPIRG